MKVEISRISKKDSKDISYYKYSMFSKRTIALSIWMELMEPRYLLNKQSFLRAWKLFTGSELDIVVGETFQYEVLLDYLTFFNSSKLEFFLEKIWGGYLFDIFIKK